jgi:hypothetical protein
MAQHSYVIVHGQWFSGTRFAPRRHAAAHRTVTAARAQCQMSIAAAGKRAGNRTHASAAPAAGACFFPPAVESKECNVDCLVRGRGL